jgi:hypothetical protein
MKTIVQLILNATAAGKAMLLAADAAAQKALLSLTNVDNTSDVNKPVSSAQAAAIAAKIGGSVGAADNRIVRSDGTGTLTVQTTGITVDDSNNVSGVGTISSGAITSSGNLAIRNALTAMSADIFETFTSSTNYGSLCLKATSSGHQIASARGSAGGSNRDLMIGHLDGTGTMTAALTGLSIYSSGLVETRRAYLLESFQGHFSFGRNALSGAASAPGVVGGDLGITAANSSSGTVDTRLRRLSSGSLGVISGDANSTTPGSFTAGAITASGLIGLGTYTVATLPSSSANAGRIAQVTDSSVTANGSAVSGGGANRVMVFSNGTTWDVVVA